MGLDTHACGFGGRSGVLGAVNHRHYLEGIDICGQSHHVGTSIGAVVAYEFAVDACIIGIFATLDIHII